MFAEDQLSLLVRLQTTNRNIDRHCARMRMAIQAADVAMNEVKHGRPVIEKVCSNNPQLIVMYDLYNIYTSRLPYMANITLPTKNVSSGNI